MIYNKQLSGFSDSVKSGGEYISCITATGVLTIKTDSGEEFLMTAGMVHHVGNDKIFKSFQITSSVINDTIQLNYGQGDEYTAPPFVGTGGAIVSPQAGDAYSVAVSQKTIVDTPFGLTAGVQQSTPTQDMSVCTCAITGSGLGVGTVDIKGASSGNISSIPVINLQTGDVYWDGKIPANKLGAQFHFQFAVTGMAAMWIINNTNQPISCYPAMSNGPLCPFKPV